MTDRPDDDAPDDEDLVASLRDLAGDDAQLLEDLGEVLRALEQAAEESTVEHDPEAIWRLVEERLDDD